MTWVNIVGLGDINLIPQLCEMFGLHNLALEDVIHVHQRPKVEEYDDHVCIVTRTLINSRDNFETGQITIFIGYPFGLTLMEAVALGLIFYFRHKEWLGKPRPSSQDKK